MQESSACTGNVRCHLLHTPFVFGDALNRSDYHKIPKLVNNEIQGVSRLVNITVGGNFLGLRDQKFHINMCPILDGYGVTGIF